MSKDAESAEREASRWIARLEAHDVSLRDHQRFRQWLARAPENRVAYEGVARTWDKMDALALLDQPIAETGARPSRRLLLLGGGGAAVAAGLAAGFVLLPGVQDANAAPYLTRVGEQKKVRFGDGSSAELNSDTAMRVTIAAADRRVRLLQGEALFDVAHDPVRPFIVSTQLGELRAHGTSFLVKIGAGNVRATVLQGSVEAVQRRFLTSEKVALVSRNDEITLNADTMELMSLASDVVAHRTAWRTGTLAFDGDTLADAALDVERQTGVHFQIDGDAAALRVGGYISANDVAAFRQLIEQNLNLHTRQASPSLVVVTR